MHFSADFSLASLASGLAGGLIIGASSSALLLTLGKISGVSGITAYVTRLEALREGAWNYAWVAGILSSGILLSALDPGAFGRPDDLAQKISPAVLAASGVLMGFATRLGYGCTSGHGVCGLPRFSLRSLVAVGTFMGTAIATVSAVRNIAPLRDAVFSGGGGQGYDALVALLHPSLEKSAHFWPMLTVLFCSAILFNRPGLEWLWRTYMSQTPSPPVAAPAAAPFHVRFHLAEHAISLACGLTFGLGLGVAGMSNPETVAQFLDFSSEARGWNPTLMAVLGGAVLFNAVTFKWMHSNAEVLVTHPATPKSVPLGTVISYGATPANLNVSARLVLGNALFGIAWGLTGVCPGPATVGWGAGTTLSAIYLPALATGYLVFEAAESYFTSSPASALPKGKAACTTC